MPDHDDPEDLTYKLPKRKHNEISDNESDIDDLSGSGDDVCDRTTKKPKKRAAAVVIGVKNTKKVCLVIVYNGVGTETAAAEDEVR